ncbi:MAG: OsmC family peroxiredoxin, partial [candidate division NC10 bacterium]|nr:OsmC family peroxiredoxin [candidate division NC10 bacterium]
MATRNAEAIWEGNLKSGKGTMKLGSGAFDGPYSFRSRFEDGEGTNPEELIGAAHAGCFSMAFSAGLEKAGHSPERVHSRALELCRQAEASSQLVAVLSGISQVHTVRGEFEIADELGE